MKLTKAQIAVLERMANGDEVWTITGRRYSAFWRDNMRDRAPSSATIHALWKAGVIGKYQSAGGQNYQISNAGRRALEEGGGK